MGDTPPRSSGKQTFLPLKLVREHLDAIEGLWLRRHPEWFSTLSTGFRIEPWSRRLEAHVRALADDREEAVREASLRLASPHRSTAFAAAYALLRIAPAQCFDKGGACELRSRHTSAMVEALQRAPIRLSPTMGDPLTVEAQSGRAEIPDGFLMSELLSGYPRAGLIAASRARSVPRWASRQIMRLAAASLSSPRRGWRALALYAWGAISARAQDSAAFAALVDALLGDDLFVEPQDRRPQAPALGESASLLATAVTGHAATARRVARRIESEGPSIDLLYALGLLGIPRHARALLLGLSSPEQAVQNEALRALYFLTGRLFVRRDDGGVSTVRSVRKDGGPLAPDRARAEAYLRDWAQRDSLDRFHLGVSLRREVGGAPPSFRFLRAVLTGEPRNLACELLPGLFDGRPRTIASPFTIAPGRMWSPIRTPSPAATNIPMQRRGAAE